MPLLTVDQDQYLCEVWTNMTYTLAFAGNSANLVSTLNKAFNMLNEDRAIVENAKSQLSRLFATASTTEIGKSQLTQFNDLVSKALGTAIIDTQNINNTNWGANGRNGSQNIPPYLVRSADMPQHEGLASLQVSTRRREQTLEEALQQRHTKCLLNKKNGGKCTVFPMSSKVDLTPMEIGPTANCLLVDDASSFFSNNQESIYEAWTSSRCSNIVAAFDLVHILTQHKKSNLLKLRFAYIHLMRIIDSIDITIKGQKCHHINTIVINTYLDAQTSVSDKRAKKGQLLENIRIAKRMPELAGPSPFQLSVYTGLAETIM
jgi:hypothetical protein